MKTKTYLFIPFVVASLFLSNAHLRAAALNLTPGTPDFVASSLAVTYVPGSNVFSVVGLTIDYQGGSAPLVYWGNYSLTASINQSGFLNFGSLTISGDIGSGMETLLSGNLKTGQGGTALGFQDPPGGDIFEFLFTVTGGDPVVVSDFGGLGSGNHGVVVNAVFENGGFPFNGTWTSFCRNDGHSGVSDTFAQVPEPGALALLFAWTGVWIILHRSRPRKVLSLAITR
jgi:hypothetical protein